jgi:predicted DNA binding CopG/RHH family protein/uncharacterized DUF497 family protein
VIGGIEFDWDAGNTKHLAAHKVTPAEFEQLMSNDPLELDYLVIDGEGRYRSIGITNGGRILSAAWTIRGARCAPSLRSRPVFQTRKVFGEIPMKKQSKRVVPAFATEAEEAEWWFKNRNAHDKQFLAAVKSGEVQVLTKEKLLKRIAASKKTPSPVVALRIPEADLALARKQAEEKGLPYQTYLKSLLHETLAKREKQKTR